MQINFKLANYLLDYSIDDNRDVLLSDDAKNDFKEVTQLPYALKSSAGCELFRVQEIINGDYTFDNLDSDSFFLKIWDTDIRAVHRGIWLLLDLTMAEIFTINYLLKSDKSYLEYYTTKDMNRVITNIDYLCYWFGNYRHYRFMVQYLRGLQTALGYSIKQMGIVKNTTDLRYSIDKTNGV